MIYNIVDDEAMAADATVVGLWFSSGYNIYSINYLAIWDKFCLIVNWSHSILVWIPLLNNIEGYGPVDYLSSVFDCWFCIFILLLWYLKNCGKFYLLISER